MVANRSRAECVADSFEKPLYQVTCGDVGTNSAGLEERLEGIFDYAVTWGAILLLDEADVFLQERDYQDLKRNALVSSKFLSQMYCSNTLPSNPSSLPSNAGVLQWHSLPHY